MLFIHVLHGYESIVWCLGPRVACSRLLLLVSFSLSLHPYEIDNCTIQYTDLQSCLISLRAATRALTGSSMPSGPIGRSGPAGYSLSGEHLPGGQDFAERSSSALSPRRTGLLRRETGLVFVEHSGTCIFYRCHSFGASMPDVLPCAPHPTPGLFPARSQWTQGDRAVCLSAAGDPTEVMH